MPSSLSAALRLECVAAIGLTSSAAAGARMGPRRANAARSHVGGVVSEQASGAVASSSASRGRQAAPAPARMGARGAEEKGRRRNRAHHWVSWRGRQPCARDKADEVQRVKHVAKRAKLDAVAAKATAAEAARAGRREVAVALANKKNVKPKRCMCQMEWCQAQSTVDSYSHALKSRKPA